MADDEREALIRLWHGIAVSSHVCTNERCQAGFLLRRLDEARAQITRDRLALTAAVQRFVALNSEGNAHTEHLCRQALAALADENGAVEAPQSQG